MMKKRNIIILIILVPILAGPVYVEFLLRLFPNILNIEHDILLEGNFEYSDKAKIIRPSADLAYEFIPGSIREINSLGMLDKKRVKEKDKDAVRLFLIGDGISVNGRISQLLEAGMRETGENEHLEVWNCGVGGYQASQYSRYIESNAVSYDPDIIVCCISQDDFDYGQPYVYKTVEGQFSEYFNRFPRISRYIYARRSYRAFKTFRLLMYIGEFYLTTFENRRGKDLYSTECNYWLSRIKKYTSVKDRKIVFIVFPYLKKKEMYTKRELYTYDTMINTLKKHGLSYIDLVEMTEGSDLAKYRQNKVNILDPGPEGDEYFSGMISSELQKILDEF